jgi:hypothetical protein
LNSGNACHLSVQNLLPSRLLSENLRIRLYKTIFLPLVLYGRETWSLTFREELKLRVFENKVLRGIFGSKRDGLTGVFGNCITKSCPWWAGHTARMGRRGTCIGYL